MDASTRQRVVVVNLEAICGSRDASGVLVEPSYLTASCNWRKSRGISNW